MPGANLTASQPYRLVTDLYGMLGEKEVGLGSNRTFFTKAGVPASNTAADDPGTIFCWCKDITNNHWYLCTAYTNSTTFTWTLII